MSKKSKEKGTNLMIVFTNGNTMKFRKGEWTDYYYHKELFVVRRGSKDIYGCNFRGISEWCVF